MERVESLERLRELTARGRPVMSNCYRMLRDFEAAIAAGRLYACPQEGALLLMEEWPDVFQVYASIYDAAAPCALPQASKPLLVEVVARSQDARGAEQIQYWRRAGFVLARTRCLLEQTKPPVGGPQSSVRVSAPDDRLLAEATTLFRTGLDRLTVRLPYALESGHVLCALNGEGKLMGALHFSLANGVGMLEHLAVWPAYRRNGAASALMAAWIRQTDAVKRRLWVIDDNLPARALYAKWGFTDAARRCASLLYPY